MSVKEALKNTDIAGNGSIKPVTEEFSFSIVSDPETRLDEGVELLEKTGGLEMLRELYAIMLTEDTDATYIMPRTNGANAVYAEVRWGIKPTEVPEEVSFKCVTLVARPHINKNVEVWGVKRVSLQPYECEYKAMFELAIAKAAVNPGMGTEKGSERRVIIQE